MDKITLLKELTMLDATPGFEKEVRNYMKNHFEEMGYEYVQDNLGGIYAHKPSKNPDAPTVLIAGHMDEVGFMVTGYTKHGLIKFAPLGGWWSQVLLSKRVKITNTDGTKYTGVVSSLAPHLLTPEMLKKPFETKDMLIDCGFEDEEDAKKHVKIGSFATPVSEFEKLNEYRYLGKAFDNRYGCAMAIDILNTFKDIELDINLYVGATVQEEVGLRGAKVAGQMIKPDLFIAVDASPARDTSGEMDEFGRLGKGYLVRILDRTMILSKNIRDYAISKSEENNISYQYFTSPGGTDAGAIHLTNSGVPSIVIGIPSRGIHTASSIMDIRDYDAAKEIISVMLKDLDTNTIKELRNV